MAEKEDKPATLAETPAWGIALVCLVIIILSLLLEHALHLLDHYLGRRRRKTLSLALHNLEAEIRAFGFMSLLLSTAEQPIADICVPIDVAKTFLPCEANGKFGTDFAKDPKCPAEDKVPVISIAGMDQLLLLIFVLAVSRVVTCSITYVLALFRISSWAKWEAETRTLEYQLSHDPRRLILSSETSFAKRHLNFWSSNGLLTWIASFFRHIFDSVSKADYLTLRHSFISDNFENDCDFDFHKLLKRSLDHDFAAVTGNSHWSWLYGMVFIFFNARRFRSYLYLPFIPLLMLLIVGTKLEVSLTRMCVDSSKEKELVPGTVCVKRDKKYFWFGKERWLLHLLNFVLFQNSFQVAFFSWTWYHFGFPSCFHKVAEDVVVGIVVGVLIQFLCAYVTLPLYVLVSQMDSKMKKAIFADQVIHGLKKWKDTARKNMAAEKYDPSTPFESVRSGRPDTVLHGLRNWMDSARKNLAGDGDKIMPMTTPDSIRSSNRGSAYSEPHGDTDDRPNNAADFDPITETPPGPASRLPQELGRVTFELGTPASTDPSPSAESVVPSPTTTTTGDAGKEPQPEQKQGTAEDTITEMETRIPAFPRGKDKAYDGEASFGNWHDDDLQIRPPSMRSPNDHT